MPVPPKQLKESLAENLDSQPFQHWPQLGQATVRWRGSHGYPLGHFDDDPDGHGFPKGRIEYLGDTDDWAFAPYQPGSESHVETILPSGSRAGLPTEAPDLACSIHLADITGHPQ